MIALYWPLLPWSDPHAAANPKSYTIPSEKWPARKLGFGMLTTFQLSEGDAPFQGPFTQLWDISNDSQLPGLTS